MLTTICMLLVIVLVLFGAYSCMREGAFFACYVFFRNLIAFLVAISYCEALAVLMQRFISDKGPAYDYFLVISFGVLFGATTTIARQIKVRTTVAEVPCQPIFDRLVGLFVGGLNGMLVSGTFLVMVSLMPFLAFMPVGIARFEMDQKPVDTGAPLLKFYNTVSNRFGGDNFPLTAAEGEEGIFRGAIEHPGYTAAQKDVNGNGLVDLPEEEYVDLNGNGQWDVSWLTRYRDCWKLTTAKASRAGVTLWEPIEDEE